MRDDIIMQSARQHQNDCRRSFVLRADEVVPKTISWSLTSAHCSLQWRLVWRTLLNPHVQFALGSFAILLISSIYIPWSSSIGLRKYVVPGTRLVFRRDWFTAGIWISLHLETLYMCLHRWATFLPRLSNVYRSLPLAVCILHLLVTWLQRALLNFGITLALNCDRLCYATSC